MRHNWLQVWMVVIALIGRAFHRASATNVFDTDMKDKSILDELLNGRRYDRRVRPEASGAATNVEVNVEVLSLSSPDESSYKYDLEFLFHQRWEDNRLSFHGGHDYLNGIHHRPEIWVPDTHFIKYGEKTPKPEPDHIAVKIYRNGTVHYTIRKRLSLSCSGDLKVFPFDHPKCTFSMESISYEANELQYYWKQDGNKVPGVYVPTKIHVLNAYLVDHRSKPCDRSLGGATWRGNYSCIQIDLVFRRDKSFYFSTVFIPGMLLVTSSFITFWLEWNAVPGRVMLGVTTMLNFFTTANNFRSNLPVVSSLYAMNVWDSVCMCFIYASLLEFVVVNYLGRKKPRLVRSYRPASATIEVRDNNKGETAGNHENVSCNTCPPNKCVHVERLIIQAQDPPKLPYFDLSHPLGVAKSIDAISRIVFPVAYGVFLIYFFVIYSS